MNDGKEKWHQNHGYIQTTETDKSNTSAADPAESETLSNSAEVELKRNKVH